MNESVKTISYLDNVQFRFDDGTLINGLPKNLAEADRLFQAGLYGKYPNQVAKAIGHKARAKFLAENQAAEQDAAPAKEKK